MAALLDRLQKTLHQLDPDPQLTAALTALYQWSESCWREMLDHTDHKRMSGMALQNNHPIYSTVLTITVRKSILSVAEQSPEDAPFLYFMLGILLVSLRDWLDPECQAWPS